ncbi:MAG: TonB-dependent receptor [Bacteroidetes bacterium]|nr:TonB-dependent receptor [Bacteroidota bacterium]
MQTSSDVLLGQSVADSSVSYTQPVVVVSATRLVPRSAETMGTVVRLDGWSIRRLDGRSLDAVLEDEGGLFIRDIGGPGGIKTVSLRNAPATQTVVQLNGMRLNSPQNSLVDFGLYPAAIFDAVAVVRGGQSLLFGSDANAGAVVLGIWPSMKNDLTIGARSGSFGEGGADLRWDQAGRYASTSVRFGVDRSDGDFPFTWVDADGASDRLREGASYQRWHAAASAVVHGVPWGHVEATVMAVSSDRGSPGPVTAGPTTLARLRDKVAHLVIRAVHQEAGGTGWEGGMSASFQEESYEERNDIITPPDRFVTRILSGWVQGRWRISDAVVAGTGIEVSTAELEGDAFTQETRRVAASITSSADWTNGTSGLRILPMVRWELMSDQRPSFGPRLAAELPLVADGMLTARASLGAGVRTPNFNELYWQPGGDPHLRPERVVTADAGVHLRTHPDGAFSASINAFFADTRDRITGWPPVNLARTVSEGADVNAVWRTGVFRWWANATYAMVESRSPSLPGRQVPFVPRWLASTGLDVSVGPLILSPVVRYLSRRFTTLDNLAALSLPPTTRVSVAGRLVGVFVGRRMSLIGTVDNLLDVAGTSIPGYPLPGRSFRLGVSIGLIAHDE